MLINLKELATQVILEGVYDPGIFKAIFLAGGPGSGKTYVAGKLFGIPAGVNLSPFGLKMVNQDAELEYFLKKFGFGVDIDKMPTDVFRQLTDPGYKDYTGLRTHAKDLSAQRLELYKKGRLGLIVDGTGHKFKDVKKQRKELIDLGYDTYMVFVNTSLDVAQKRNMERPRKLPVEVVEKSWKEVQDNMSYFQGIFGSSNFLLVDNSKFLSEKDAQKKFNMLVSKGVNKFIKKPIKNKLAKKWVEKQQILRKSGIKERKKELDLYGKSVVYSNTEKKEIVRGLNEANDKAQLMKLYTKAMKMMPHSPAQKKVNKQIKALRKKLKMDEGTSKIKKVVGIYGGRFQPFGPHHKKVYEWMKKQFDDVYITTSDIKRPPKHPMNFKEKVRHMTKMGIPSNKIIQEKSPYVAANTLKKFDSETTAVVYAFGAKDAGRLKGGKYFQDYKKNKNNMNGFEEEGYIITAPHVSMKAAGMEVSGTAMRQLLGSPKYADDRERRFKKYFGYFDKGIYQMMTNKFSKLFESFKLTKDLIEEFLVDVDINKIIKESSISANFPTDDGPPIHYKGFGDYKRQSKKWIDTLYAEKGWEVIDFLLGKHAINPDFDYTMKYTVVPAVAYGRKQSGEYGTRFGVNDPIEKYKEHMNRVLGQVGWEVLKWMGITPDGKGYTGVEVEPPVLPGVGKDNTVNTDRAERQGEKNKLGNVKLHTLKEFTEYKVFSSDWWKKELMLEKDIKPDVIKSFIIRNSLNTKVWDGDKLKPEIRKKLLLIAKNFFKDLELEPNVKLQDITLTGSISNYNWSKFSDIDLHLRIDFSTVDDDEDFVQNYVLAKKTIWNNKHDIKMYGFPVEVYVENIGEAHVASGLYSILNDKWLVVPKKKELQIDLDDIRSKAEGYLGSMSVLQDLMKKKKYDEVIEMVEKIQDKLKRMRSSGLARGGEFSVENLAFKALRRSPFIAQITNLKTGAYDKMMTMNGSKNESFSKDWWKELLIEDWWTDMSPEAQKAYISQHKTPKSVQPKNPSGKKPRDVDGNFEYEKQKQKAVKQKLKQKHHEPEEGPTPENHEKYYVHQNENSAIIGTPHLDGKDPKTKEFIKKNVLPKVDDFIEKHGAENVVFMAEGGDEGDNYVEGSEQHMVGDHVEGQGGTVDTFDGPEMSQWVNQEGSKDENGDDLFDRLSKNSKPPKTRSQSAAGIYAMMVGQGDDGGDAMEYMGESSGVDQKEAEQYLKDNGYVGSIPPKNKSEKRHLYLLAFPGDASEKEKKKYNIKEPNGVSEVTDSHNKARQNNMIKKKEQYEKEGKKVLVVPGASHAFEMRNEFSEKKKQESVFSKDWWKKQLLQEGGAYRELLKDIKVSLLIEGGAAGHMNHPFDDKNLTFTDLKNIIIYGLGGNLNREDNVTEKLDGQNLMISWKNGRLVTARNKGQLRNYGESSMDVKGVASKFAGRGDIKDAFVFAMKDLEKAAKSLSDKQKEKVFGNGKKWMNLEVIYPASANVIDYDKAQIIFHGALEYDESGKAIGEAKDSARMLAGMIKQVNQDVQKHFKIGKPQFLEIPKVQDFGKKKKVYLNRLKKLQNQYKLKDNDTLSKYHQSFWEEFIFNSAKQMKYKVPNRVLVNLTKRWAFLDKSYSVQRIKGDIKNTKFLDWILSFDKNDHSKWVKQNMKPFEVLFFDVGAEILKNIGGYLAASPKTAVQKIRKDVINAIKTVKSGGDVKKIQTLKHQLEKLEKIGGLSSIVPSEGIVFKYKGNTYKFTGAFAPVNQIMGLLNF